MFNTISHKILSKLPLKKTILFESNPEFGCNTYPLYRYLLDHGWNQNDRFIWLVKNKSDYKQMKRNGLHFVNKLSRNPLGRLQRLYYRSTARCLISSNKVLSKNREGQLSVFLGHGSKTKKTKGFYEVGNNVDYVLCQADFFKDVTAYEYNVSKEKLVCLGYPRNDYLYQKKDVLSMLLPGVQGKKIIVWLPTWRNSEASNDGYHVSGVGFPLLPSQDAVRQLNDFLNKNNTVILVKPHPLQDIRAIQANSLSNFFVINDALLASKEIQLYEVLAQSDALLTDYSSVFFDYLLTDKPIGLTMDDLQHFCEKRGFAYDIQTVHKAGVPLRTADELYGFITDLLEGRDEREEMRAEVRNLTNAYQDGQSAERVAAFIKEKLTEKEIKNG